MDLSFISEYAVPVIVGICLCVGYVIKTSFSSIDNKSIPLIMAILGVALNIWINMSITPEIIFTFPLIYQSRSEVYRLIPALTCLQSLQPRLLLTMKLLPYADAVLSAFPNPVH